MKRHNLPRQERRRDRLLRERVHDPYKTRLKLPDPAVCTDCGAVYQGDRWQWSKPHPEAKDVVCAACHRIRDHCPAGEVRLSGRFMHQHRAEILNLARNEEAKEKGEHALHRIMGLEDEADGILITTTDIHLPRRIGEALQRAFHGKLDYRYEEESYFIRVAWSRDD